MSAICFVYVARPSAPAGPQNQAPLLLVHWPGSAPGRAALLGGHRGSCGAAHQPRSRLGEVPQVPVETRTRAFRPRRRRGVRGEVHRDFTP